MKVILTVDESSHSESSVQELKGLKLRDETDITVLTVVPDHTFLGGIRLDMLRGGAKAKEMAHKSQEQQALERLQQAVQALPPNRFKIKTLIRWGKPSEQLVAAIREEKADLVIVGAKGSGSSPLFPFGSTAQKIMKHAGCSVLITRGRTPDIRRVLLATDGSTHAAAAVDFLVNMPLPHSASVIIVTALHSHLASYFKAPTLDLETSQDILAELQTAEEKQGQSLLEVSRKQFRQHNYEALTVILRGDPTQEILAAAERFNPDLIVLGAKGLSGIEDFMLGSVSQRVAKYARCSVLIVRPKRTRNPSG